jgi:hypothetical protein
LIFRHAEAQDDPALQRLLSSNPMQGWIRLSLQRQPSYFASEDLMGRSSTVIILDAGQDNEVVGMFRTTFMPFYFKGSVVEGGYLSELRINKAYRNRLRILRHGFESIKWLNLPESSATSIWFTSIASDNSTARRLLESENSRLPRYIPAGELLTLVISVKHCKPTAMLQSARQEDILAICELYNRQASQYDFASHLDPEWLRSLTGCKGLRLADFWVYRDHQGIQAVVAVWDQRAIKQVVVQGYRPPLNRLRPFYNLLASLTGRPKLPPRNARLESVYLSFFACTKRVENDAVLLLREALLIAKRKHAESVLLGISAGNPLLPLLRANLRPVEYSTCIETVNWQHIKHPGTHRAMVQPEIAIL